MSNQRDYVAAPPGEVYWRYSVPKRTDAKMLLLTKGGVSVLAEWRGALGEFYLAWSPMPKRNKAEEARLNIRL